MLGSAAMGAGLLVMAAAPTLALAICGAALAGTGNGVEAVAARTTLQEQVDPEWMALIMSLNESLFQAIPGVGIVLGGVITAAAGTRAALTIAGAGALVVAVAAWTLLGGTLAIRRSRSPADRSQAIGCRSRAPCLHRHRLEHHAAAGRGVRRGAAGGGAPGACLHAHRSGGPSRRDADRGQDRGGCRRRFRSATPGSQARRGGCDRRGHGGHPARQQRTSGWPRRSGALASCRSRSCPARRRPGWPFWAPSRRSGTCRVASSGWSTWAEARPRWWSGLRPIV